MAPCIEREASQTRHLVFSHHSLACCYCGGDVDSEVESQTGTQLFLFSSRKTKGVGKTFFSSFLLLPPTLPFSVLLSN